MNKCIIPLLLAVFLFCACGKVQPAEEPVLYQNHKLPDAAAFNQALQEERSAEEAAAAAAEEAKHIDWVPVGGYSCITQNHTIYVRVESVDLSAGTAELFYQVTENKGENSGVKHTTGTVTRTDYGGGKLAYTVVINDEMTLTTEGYAAERTGKLSYNGSTLAVEFHGNGK